MWQLKQHAELFGQAFVAIDSHGRNLANLFGMNHPPAFSSEGVLNSCTKSDLDLLLYMYIMESSARTGLSRDEELVAPKLYEFISIDGGSLIPSLTGTAIQGKPFDGYFNKIFYPMILHEFGKWSNILDIVWDQDRTMKIKGATRENEEREPNNVYLVQQK